VGYDLNDKVVVITGASGGIGRAAAVAFAGAGARVVAAARSADKLDALARELGTDSVEPIPADVTDSAARNELIDRARARFGRIDVLVNNAGWASFASVATTPSEHVARMTALNLAAPIALVQAVLPEMLERRSGQIINISSVVGTQAIPRMTVYSATKAALTSFSTGLRMELRGTGVDVINIAPGSTRTDFFDAAASVDVKAARFAKTQYSPRRVARAIVRASRRRSREVALSADGIAITIIRRFSHRLADAIMYRVAKWGMPARAGDSPAQALRRDFAEPPPERSR